MKIIQMMGPNHPKGGEWAQEIALGAVTLPVRILGTVIFCLIMFIVVRVFSLH